MCPMRMALTISCGTLPLANVSTNYVSNSVSAPLSSICKHSTDKNFSRCARRVLRPGGTQVCRARSQPRWERVEVLWVVAPSNACRPADISPSKTHGSARRPPTWLDVPARNKMDWTRSLAGNRHLLKQPCGGDRTSPSPQKHQREKARATSTLLPQIQTNCFQIWSHQKVGECLITWSPCKIVFKSTSSKHHVIAMALPDSGTDLLCPHSGTAAEASMPDGEPCPL